MSIEHVLMLALVMYVFYHFMCRCNRVEGLSKCAQALQSLCGYTAGSGSCKDCNKCVSSNYKSSKELRDVGCSVKTLKEFCSLPEQQQVNTLYLFNDGQLKDDGKAKLMEILREYTIGRQRGNYKNFKLQFGISNGLDTTIINIANLEKEYSDNSIKIYGSASIYHGDKFKNYGTFSLQYSLPNEDLNEEEYFVIQLYDNNIYGNNIGDYLINITAYPETNDPVKVLNDYNIKFSYYLC